MSRSWLKYVVVGVTAIGFGLTAVGPAAAQGEAPILTTAVEDSADGARFWARADYLLWWIKAMPLPPLVTTGPIGTLGAGGRPGTLGQPGTVVLIGDKPQEFGAFSGANFTAGSWLDNEQTVGIEASYLFLAQRSATKSFAAPGTPGSAVLSIPFFNTLIGAEDTTGIAFPRAVAPFSGSVDFAVRSRLQGSELNAVSAVAAQPGFRWELLGGFRWIALDESLDFHTVSQNVPPAPLDIFQTFDRFQGSTDFYGLQLGTRAELSRGRWSVQAGGKVALGLSHQVTKIEGVLGTNDFSGIGPVQFFPGGYLALPTNSGRFNEDHFAVVPEVNLTLGWHPTDRVNVSLGYSFLYVSSATRPGDQIDRVINPTQGTAYFVSIPAKLAGAPRPTFLDNSSDFWAQGLRFAVELRY